MGNGPGRTRVRVAGSPLPGPLLVLRRLIKCALRNPRARERGGRMFDRTQATRRLLPYRVARPIGVLLRYSNDSERYSEPQTHLSRHLPHPLILELPACVEYSGDRIGEAQQAAVRILGPWRQAWVTGLVNRRCVLPQRIAQQRVEFYRH